MMAYVLVDTLRRRFVLTQFSRDALMQTNRLKLLKLGARGDQCGAFHCHGLGCPNKIRVRTHIYPARSALRRCGPRQTTRHLSP